ncbi:HI1506-related protein [Frigidibacter oleivorans]|uniref:HI1506-related protein n=1 Tax=Frigidibacter oleivorans TaxID=2487129 RepID=UPI000F8EB3DF|nr:HI1506-related protein [Frigidibacter oleivorans]
MARRTPNTSRAEDSPAGAKAQAAAEAVVAAEAAEATSAPDTEGATDAGTPENPRLAADAGASASGDGGQPPGDDSAPLPCVKVTGPKKGRRRAGRAFGREPVLIPMDDLTEDELEALSADPALTVEFV